MAEEENNQIVVQPKGVPAQIANDPYLAGVYGMAFVAVESGFTKFKRVSEALYVIARGNSLGLTPVESLEGFHVIEGRPSISAQLMNALMWKSGLRVDDTSIPGKMGRVTVFEKNSKGDWERRGEASFTIEEAKAAGLLGKPTWQKYPNDMLFSRAITRAFRKFSPHLALGLYIPDELEGTSPMRSDATGNVRTLEHKETVASQAQLKEAVRTIDTVVVTEPAPEQGSDEVEATVEYLFAGDDRNEDPALDGEIMDPNSVVDLLDAEMAYISAEEPPAPKPRKSKAKAQAEPETQTPPPTAGTDPLWKLTNILIAEGGKSYITIEAASTLDGEIKKFWCSQPKLISLIDRAFGEHKLVKLTLKGRQVSAVEITQ